MPSKVMPQQAAAAAAEEEEDRWNMPDDERCDWSTAAASDASAAKLHVQQTKKSWVLTTPPRSIDTSQKQGSATNKQKEPGQVVSPLAASRLAPFLKNSSQTSTLATPATFASTPDTFTSPEEPLPESYVTMIANAFGHKADLYRDVLGISRTATPRTVRIAYFKRGRQVLSQGSPRSMKTSQTVGGQINETARLRFQAVSMAYEIISNPTWLDAYERCMLITESDEEDNDGMMSPPSTIMSPSESVMSPPDSITETAQVLSDPDVSMSSTRSLASTSALRRRSKSADGRRRNISSSKSYTGGVRWNEEVEELVFNQDPEERKKPKKKKKSKKKKKKRIAVDEGLDLEKHLEQLDKEAEKNFVHDFLDDLEQSIDQLLSFRADEEESGNEEEEVEVVDVSRQLFPEMETELVPEELSTPKQPKKKRQVPGAPRKTRSSSRKLETSDIDDEEFGIYERHRQRPPSKYDRVATNPFGDNSTPAESDSRQEVARGSHLSETTPREGSAIDNDADDEESYVSFPELENRVKSTGGDSTARSDQANFNPKAPHSPKASRGESAWQPSPHSPSRKQPRSTTDASSLRTPKTAMRNNRGRQAQDTANEFVFSSPDGEQSHLPDHPPSPRSPKSSSSRMSARARSRSKEKKKYFIAPNDIAVTKRYQKSYDDGDSAVHTVDDSVSTLSASVVQRHINRDLTNSRYKEGIEQDRHQQQMERLQQQEDAVNISNSIVDHGTDADNTMTRDVVVPIKPPAKTLESVQEVSRETSRDISHEASRVDSSAVNTSVEVSLNTSGNDIDTPFCLNLCGEDLAETARAAGIAQGTPDDPSFTAFLMVYLNAMAADLARLGHSIQENVPSLPTFDFIEISDKDLGGMLNILETEMEEVPDDIAKTLSQEFLPPKEEETVSTLREHGTTKDTTMGSF